MKAAFLRARARPFLPELALISALSALGALASLAVPWLAGSFLGGMVGGQVPENPGVTVSLLVLALIALAVLNVLVQIVSELASGRILAGLRRDTHDHLMALGIAFHDGSQSGDLLSLATNDATQLSGFLTRTLATVPSLVLTAAGALVLLFVLDPVTTLALPILLAVFLLMMKLSGRRLRTLAVEARQADMRLFSLARRNLDLLPAIKAFGTEPARRSAYDAACEESRRLALRRARVAALLSPLASLLAGLTAIGILVIGSDQVAAGTRTPADLFAFLLYAALLTRPASGLADFYGALQTARGNMARLEAVFGQPGEPGYAGRTVVDRAKGAIAFEAVDFAYKGRAPVIAGLDLAIAAGEVVALTGSNGIGKSTLIRLLLRFYDPQGGRITLDGEDIAGLQVQSLRRQFGYVPQRPLLMDDTVRENIVFDAEDRSPERIERAARLSQAWEFIQRLPQGLDTVIGDNGVRLSGGQQQRIALARALYRDPPIYIFDEATSMYDLEGEAAFVESAIAALKDRTVIIITHRPASLAMADRIIDLDQARVAGPVAVCG
ncbi:ABC transporter ATP-binding protein [Erythrobacter sp. CCH5-A1]|jgi:ATP-binding cassette subfamily B protein/subfamily B ATP-binding cassette protein MsbA|uniref:ABC transporter ATP-binding protein n=1 Tax=Erythrobacter sp. CCH5-A1 TaxID=1768792 RepID=UPI000832C074|nr:ABC transporter ATP-binding protein [Erythrobacter sp. CCH5-A1]